MDVSQKPQPLQFVRFAPTWPLVLCHRVCGSSPASDDWYAATQVRRSELKMGASPAVFAKFWPLYSHERWPSGRDFRPYAPSMMPNHWLARADWFPAPSSRSSIGISPSFRFGPIQSMNALACEAVSWPARRYWYKPQNPNPCDLIAARFDLSILSRWLFPYPTRMIAPPPFCDLIPAQLGALPPAGDWNSLTSGSVIAIPVASPSRSAPQVTRAKGSQRRIRWGLDRHDPPLPRQRPGRRVRHLRGDRQRGPGCARPVQHG